MKTLKEKVLPVGSLMVAMVLFTIGLYFSSPAKADTPGCETVLWGFLGSQRRSICDSDRRPDGSWQRARVIWTPAHYVRGTWYCSRYGGCSGTNGYYVDESTQEKTTYDVFDSNVVPGEPGWLCCTGIAPAGIKTQVA